MRRTSASGPPALATVLLTTLLTLLATLAGAPADAAEKPHPESRDAQPSSARKAASSALGTAERVLAGTARPGDPSPTVALRDLFSSLPDLPGSQRPAAEAMLARPTDGAADPQGDGYAVPSRRLCGPQICVHYVQRTADAPTGMAWVRRTLRLMERVRRHQVETLGYRAPLRDGRRGGDARFDVYLKDIGAHGYYGYCTAERRRQRFLASGFCVLDDDFSRSQFGSPPAPTQRVTAAHEFFHAVQYAYDFAEDRWLLETTATWMEEQFADGVDDNRQYLAHGQLRRPAVPLDTWGRQSLAPYGNWVFFEHLAGRYGARVVRQVWEAAAAGRGARDLYSLQALASTLARRGTSFKAAYTAFVAANRVPRRAYAEGTAWPRADEPRRLRLGGPGAGSLSRTARISHLASRSWELVPARGVRRLRVEVRAPAVRTGAAALLVLHRADGGVRRRTVPLGVAGNGAVTVPFARGRIRRVSVSLVNASLRYACWSQSTWACQGRSRDDGRTYSFTALATR